MGSYSENHSHYMQQCDDVIGATLIYLAMLKTGTGALLPWDLELCFVISPFRSPHPDDGGIGDVNRILDGVRGWYPCIQSHAVFSCSPVSGRYRFRSPNEQSH